MTSKTYKTAQGKTIDLGQLKLQNEHVRAVGNMNVNARGDRLDSSNRVVDSKNQQIQRQHQRQVMSNVMDHDVHTSNVDVRRSRKAAEVTPEAAPVVAPEVVADTAPVVDPVATATPEVAPDTKPVAGGLAAAIARSRTVVQEKEKTPRQLNQSKPGVTRI